MECHTSPMHIPQAGSTMSGDHLLAHRALEHCHKCQNVVFREHQIVLSCGCGPFHMECIEIIRDEARREKKYTKAPEMSQFRCPRCLSPVVDWRLDPERTHFDRGSPVHSYSAPPNLYPTPVLGAWPRYPATHMYEMRTSQRSTNPLFSLEQPSNHTACFGDPRTPVYGTASPQRTRENDMEQNGYNEGYSASWPQKRMPSFHLPPWCGSPSTGQAPQNQEFNMFSPLTDKASAPPIASTDQTHQRHHTSAMPGVENLNPNFEASRHPLYPYDQNIPVSFEKGLWGVGASNMPTRPTRTRPPLSSPSVQRRDSSSMSEKPPPQPSFARSRQNDEDFVRQMPSVPTVMPRTPPRGFNRQGVTERGLERRAREDRHDKREDRKQGRSSGRRHVYVQGRASLQPAGTEGGRESERPDLTVHVTMDVVRHQCTEGSCVRCRQRAPKRQGEKRFSRRG